MMKVLMAFIITVLLTFLVSAQEEVAVVVEEKTVPIFDLKSGSLLGGVRNGRFVNADTASKFVKDGDQLSLYGLLGAENAGLAVNEFRFIEVCKAYAFGNEAPRSRSGLAVGKGANWNLVPRAATPIDLNNKTYVKIVSDFLKTKQFKKPPVKITQAASVDLDGDGQNEVVLSATRETGREGFGYSFVLVRKIVGKSVRNILLDGEFYPEAKKALSEDPEVMKFEVSAVADLDGDGKMEIVLNSAAVYYDGGGSEVFQIVGTKASAVKELVSGCGFF